MSKPLSFGHIEVGLRVGTESVGGLPQSETPMRIALLGDWSRQAGRGSVRSALRLADRDPVLVDRDNFEQVLTRFGVEIQTPTTSAGQTPIRFATLEDFHPDRIVQRVELFQALRELRAKLSNSATFEGAAAEMRSWISANSAVKVPKPTSEQKLSPPKPSDVNQHNLLEEILGETQIQSEEVRHPSVAGDWDSYMQKVIEPYLLPKVDYSKQAELLALVDGVMSLHLRAILHNPDLQAAEAAWRGLFFLVRRLDTDAGLQLYILDVSKEELAADLASADDLRSTDTYRLLVERTVGTPGGQPWGILVGHYTFDNSRQDVEMLGRVAKVASQAGAPFLAAASAHIVGCESLAETPDPDDWQKRTNPEDDEAWETLRRLPEAAYLGLAFPRFLLRLPYGKDTDPIEQFDFEEMTEVFDHKEYLWGSPAIACAYLLAEAFSQYGWGLRPGVLQEIDGLPMHVYQEDQGSQVKPCAEAWLTNRAADMILGKGLMPVQSVRGRDAVRLASFRSLVSPGKPLAGRWHA